MSIYTRNSDPNFWNVDRKNCNCGSFALDLTTWYNPYLSNQLEERMMPESAYTYETRHDLIEDLLDDDYSEEEIIEELLERDWEFILNSCPFLTPIQLEDAKDEDRVIAYRIMIDFVENRYGERFIEDMDFHFRVRMNGIWMEKCGAGPIKILGEDIEESPWRYPGLLYRGPIKYAKFKEECAA